MKYYIFGVALIFGNTFAQEIDPKLIHANKRKLDDEEINTILSKREAATTRLILAAQTNDTSAALQALAQSASPRGSSKYNRTERGDEPIQEALKHDNIDLFKILIGHYTTPFEWFLVAHHYNAEKIMAYMSKEFAPHNRDKALQ